MRLLIRLLAVMIVGFAAMRDASTLVGQMLDDELRGVPAADLARQALAEGDAQRGAVLFYQRHMGCAKCHAVNGNETSLLGPDLATLEREVDNTTVVEALLSPSNRIRKGFAAVTVIKVNGQSQVGLLVERTNEKLVLRGVGTGEGVITLPMSEIEEIKDSPVSIMPAGQANQLASRQQFLDLVRYVIEVRDGGAKRARELQPPDTLLIDLLPEYEERIDHAGIIGGWNDASLKRGEAIYQRVCVNCHGTKDKPGSLPTSLRFADGKFKNGSDPLAMYQTLTRGFGLMAAQSWMVPSQKYDVIQYIRETYLRPHNPSQLADVDAKYLARLPKGDTRGPEPRNVEPWSTMDYGPSLTHTYEVPGKVHNVANKGIAIRLDAGAGGVSRGRHWMVFDTDTLRVAAAWSASGDRESFIDWQGIQFNGAHQVHPRIVGDVVIANSTGPGWANPQSGSFRDDARIEGRDGLRYGPLPRDWAKFRGVYQFGQQVILSYSVGTTSVLESPRLLTLDDSPNTPVFLRTFNVAPRDRELVLQFAEFEGDVDLAVSDESTATIGKGMMTAGFAPATVPAKWVAEQGRLRLKIPAGQEPLKFTLWSIADSNQDDKSRIAPQIPHADADLTTLTKGGPRRWPQQLETQATIGDETKSLAADVLTAPDNNPWLAQLRFTGLDFFDDGRIAACTWDGDVWIVECEPGKPTLHWQRIASGLFQPLGLKIVAGKIHLTCRDQLAVLHDLNGDGEIDFYETLNNDHQVTPHFHEFAMGLQTDADGNFYYAKSARHALPAVVPHHGTLLRVSRDGSRTDILGNGFRAANGVCLNPDGSFIVTDQEGHWNPKNRINWVTLDPSGKPKFYGNMFGYHDVTDSSDTAMQPPLCWITNTFDRSPAELLWVNSKRWGAMDGALLNLSYGYGKVFVVLHETVGDVKQGGMIELPLPRFPTGVMRGRFHPGDGQLYLCGMFAWAGNATAPGGLYRIRRTEQPLHLPLGMHARKSKLELTFSEPLDESSIDSKLAEIKTWSLKRSANYGSKHFDEKTLAIRGATLSSNGRTLTLDVPGLAPTWCMELKYAFRSKTGEPVIGVIHNTIHTLAD